MNFIIFLLSFWFVFGGIIMLAKSRKKMKSIHITKGKVIGWQKQKNIYIPNVEYYDKFKKAHSKTCLKADYVIGIRPFRI